MGRHWKDRMNPGEGWPDDEPEKIDAELMSDEEFTDDVKEDVSMHELHQEVSRKGRMTIFRLFLDENDGMQFHVMTNLPKPMQLTVRIAVLQLLDQFYPLDDNPTQ